jgi:hypothetical protein
VISSRFVQVTLLGMLILGLSSACGSRRSISPITSPSTLPTSSPKPSSSPSPSPSTMTARINPTIATNDSVLAELERLKTNGDISDAQIMESYPVQIIATGTPEAIQSLQKLALGSHSGSETEISFETLSSRTSRITSSQTQAVSDENSWISLWRLHTGSDADRPTVNFEIETVLAVFSGQKRSGGYSVKITKVTQLGSELIVSYQETVPPANNLVSQSLTSPSHLVKVRLSKLNGDFSSVRFEKVQTN